MKKWLIILTLSALLAACSSTDVGGSIGAGGGSNGVGVGFGIGTGIRF
ncbi:hypothetical protein EDC44_1297 [Cricetibacter osteomyelitidis]|uniref:Lipoprotein n=1 Tax=Cricetibacter osteomyelitidis TaxID=1521931 RepID=A0A4R2STJ6_9PAST|nr:hypothetical protein [Cricetibacter osteomyelitidis]TCP92031.1 hypothetical protein EDC44_1297 [Cricetibacter osteomyelitidis]